MYSLIESGVPDDEFSVWYKGLSFWKIPLIWFFYLVLMVIFLSLFGVYFLSQKITPNRSGERQ